MHQTRQEAAGTLGWTGFADSSRFYLPRACRTPFIIPLGTPQPKTGGGCLALQTWRAVGGREVTQSNEDGTRQWGSLLCVKGWREGWTDVHGWWRGASHPHILLQIRAWKLRMEVRLLKFLSHYYLKAVPHPRLHTPFPPRF